MGCASSHLLNHDDDFSKIGSSALSHHIVSLTSTTYGLLTLDPSSSKTTVSPNPPPRAAAALRSIFPTPVSEPPPEVINSWELMAGLDSTNESFRLYSQPSKRFTITDKENSNPNKTPRFQETQNRDHQSSNLENSNPIKAPRFQETQNLNHQSSNLAKPQVTKTSFLDEFEELCPPGGENRVVVYTTTLRGVRKTFEECNSVRGVMESHGVLVCERDISMDQGFKEELRELMKGKNRGELVPPRVFVKGRYVGGSDVVMKMMEEGYLGKLLEGLPKLKVGYVCEGCGGVRFLPCFSCSGSCKMMMVDWREKGRKRVVVRCGDCNENGLVHCPICS